MYNLTIKQKELILKVWELIVSDAPKEVIVEAESAVLAALSKDVYEDVYCYLAGDVKVRGTIFYTIEKDGHLSFDARFDTEKYQCRLPVNTFVCGHLDHFSGVIVTPPLMKPQEEIEFLEVLEKALLKVRFAYNGTAREVMEKRLVSFF